MNAFEKAYRELNPQQKQAVDTINGPVLVIAGPGTGKTQLLALRAAQILLKDDTMLPSNILCLTFTDSAADNMRQRLTRYIGQDAYQVAIHTFNSFGQYIMNAYPEYFYEWREMQTADELTTHRILEEILETHPGSHVLAARGADGTFYALRQLRNFISDAKKNNLTPLELKKILDQNQATYAEITPLVRKHWPVSMTSKSALSDIGKFADAITEAKPPKPIVEGVPTEMDMLGKSLELAAVEAESLEHGKTRPFTVWKDTWLAKNESNEWIFKNQGHIEKLIAGGQIYEQYQKILSARSLVDFNDQIMWVLRVLHENVELRYSLQERFQYVMIDEFQDTNRAQLLLAQHVTDAPIHEGRPNIMVVGDDDQAVFRFQGADIGNVEGFDKQYKHGSPVVLTVNYRSTQEILDASRHISRQIELSLEKKNNLTKELHATVKPSTQAVSLNEFDHDTEHYSWVANQVNKLIKSKVRGKEIAVLARERKYLDALVPYLRALNIPIDYERSENVLEQEHIVALLKLARLVSCLGEQKLEEANALLPQILSEPMWGIEAADLWAVAQKAYTHKKFWLDVIYEQKNTRLRAVADFLIETGNTSSSLPAEHILDRLIGATNPGMDGFVSPFKDFFFGEELLKNQPANYLTLLSHLSTLRRHLRKYQTNQKEVLTIKDVLEFVDSFTRSETLRMVDKSPHREDDNAVQLMTVHKAKGLEFDNVFVIALQNDSWVKTGRSNRFSYPQNLQIIKPADNDNDDSLRLLFVAMSRARYNLQLNYFLNNEDGKAQQPYGPLLALKMEPTRPAVKELTTEITRQFEQRWLTKHSSVNRSDMKSYFSQSLSRYKISPTHLNNFLDVSVGGPLYYLTENLLHFPSVKAPYACYGTAMHAAISEAHNQVAQGKKINPDKVASKFGDVLAMQPLSPQDMERFAKEGVEALRYYLAKEASSFKPNQKVDISFADQSVVLGKARLRGDIDRIDFEPNTKTVIISDYKTGTPESKWILPPSATQYERIKMYRYKNQLMFYKLLVDGSADWGKKGWRAESGVLRFLKKNPYGKLNQVPLVYGSKEIADFGKLIVSVWGHIQALDFPDTKNYTPDINGILLFEKDLIDDVI